MTPRFSLLPVPMMEIPPLKIELLFPVTKSWLPLSTMTEAATSPILAFVLSLSPFTPAFASWMVPVNPEMPFMIVFVAVVPVKVSFRSPPPVNVLLIVVVVATVFALRRLTVEPAPTDTAPVPRPETFVPLFVVAVTVPAAGPMVTPPENVLPVFERLRWPSPVREMPTEPPVPLEIGPLKVVTPLPVREIVFVPEPVEPEIPPAMVSWLDATPLVIAKVCEEPSVPRTSDALISWFVVAVGVITIEPAFPSVRVWLPAMPAPMV